jgi:hypothetical protein
MPSVPTIKPGLTPREAPPPADDYEAGLAGAICGAIDRQSINEDGSISVHIVEAVSALTSVMAVLLAQHPAINSATQIREAASDVARDLRVKIGKQKDILAATVEPAPLISFKAHISAQGVVSNGRL